MYQITNTVNGKCYIGYTSKTPEQRFREHKKRARLGSDFHFHSAIRKYGDDAFRPEILFVEESLEGAKETEILLILDRQPEYNKTFGGDGTHGHPMTDETRDKIRRNTPVRRGEDHPLFGKSRPDTSEMNRGRKGVKNPNLARKGFSHHMFGKSHSESTLQKMSESQKGKIFSEEHRAKLSASAKARHLREKTQKNSSETKISE